MYSGKAFSEVKDLEPNQNDRYVRPAALSRASVVVAPASSTVRKAYIGSTWHMPIFMCALMATIKCKAGRW